MITLDDALDLLPDAWADDIADDAASRGCRVGYTAAAGGLRTATIRRVQHHFAERGDDADWQAVSAGQRLDECFPAYIGIGLFELLDELGIATAYGPFGLLREVTIFATPLPGVDRLADPLHGRGSSML